MGDDSSSSDDERKNESIDDKMKRITKLGKDNDIEGLVKEAKLQDCTPGMIAFAAQKSKELGNQAFAKKEYQEALDHYAGALLGEVPERYKIYSNRSACLFQLGKYTDALVEATKAIKENRSWAKGYYRAGRAALEMEYYDEAHDMFQKGLEKDPRNQDLVTWADKAREIRNQANQEKLMKKHATDYTKFEELMQQQKEEEEAQEAENDPNRIILGDRYYSSSKMEQRQLKSMLGYKEEPPPPFEPTFDSDQIFRHEARGGKTNMPIWDPSKREWRIDAKPAPSRVDYSDSQQTQAIALFLERQTDVAYPENLLNLLDEKAQIVDAYVNGVRDMINILGSQDSPLDVDADDVRWLFMGMGTCLPVMTAARYLPTATILAATAHRCHFVPDLSLTILRQNDVKHEQVRVIHRITSELAVVDPDGEDINNLTGRVDLLTLDAELFDPGLLGKGVLAKINHAKRKLLVGNHRVIPQGAVVLCAPCEMICPRGDGGGGDGLDWRAVDGCRWAAFYESTNLDAKDLQEPWRNLGPVLEVFDFNFNESEIKLSGQCELKFTVAEDGILNCITFWYRMSLTDNVALDHTPDRLRDPSAGPCHGDYHKHATQWLAAPVDVKAGDEVTIRASYSRARIRFEVTNPEVNKIDRRENCPRWLLLRMHDEQRTDAYRKAIEKALEKIQEKRLEVDKLDRKPLRIISIGAGLGQIPMIAAKAAKEMEVLTEEEADTYGYTVIALDNMPKTQRLAKRVFRDNGLDRNVYMTHEDVRKLPNQPQRAQLMISELIDPGLLGEGILVLMSLARVKMCDAFDHQCIPARGNIWAAAFEFGENLSNVHGFNCSALNHYRMGNMLDLDALVENGVARQLSNVFEVFRFDFENNVMPGAHTITINPTADGKITAIVFWYEVAMDTEGDIILANWPQSVPPADFSMMEKDVHYPNPNRQAVTYFEGHYQKEVKTGVPIEIDVGYTKAWPQFVWPGAKMVPRGETGEQMMEPPPMPRHRQTHFKMKAESDDLEQKLTHGLMFDEEMLQDGYQASERVALEPNGNPSYLIDPNNANFFHMMFYL